MIIIINKLIILLNLVMLLVESKEFKIPLVTTYYDINTNVNADFESEIFGNRIVEKIIEDKLDKNRKPILNSNRTETFTAVTSKDTFNQWFNSVPGKNKMLNGTLDFIVNDGKTSKISYDKFFPIDPYDAIHQYYSGPDGEVHNYHFCLEIHTSFYHFNNNMTISVTADDDAFLYIDNKLVVDLGGCHSAITKKLEIESLHLCSGKKYNLDFFYCERRSGSAVLKLTLPIICPNSKNSYCGPLN